MTIDVLREESRGDRKAFIDLPYRLNRDLPGWVPPLRIGEADQMNRRKNPFFQHAEVEHFLARRNGRVVGRIATCQNHAHNEAYGDRLGFFGYFDFEDDPEICAALVDAARDWLRARGLDRMRGPANYTTNDTCGTLVEGFDERPTILMPYNAPYYDARIKATGLEKAKDLLTFSISRDGRVSERMRRVIERRVARTKLVLRPIDLKNLGDDIGHVLDVYNRCWADNWGFVPATEAEFQHAAKQMIPVLEPHMSCVAELDGEPVGLSLVLRDLNVLLPGTDGRLWRALPRLLFRLKKVKQMRIIALGVLPERRGRGILEALFLRAVDEGLEHGYGPGEAGWILEDNRLMQAPILATGAKQTKRYRIYERDTAESSGAR